MASHLLSQLVAGSWTGCNNRGCLRCAEAVPKRILDVMNVAGLTRENVASHLQKYRLYLRKMNNVPPGQRGNKQMPGLVPNSPQDPHQLQHQHQQLALQQQQQQAAAAGQAASLAPPVAAAAVSAQMGMPPIVGTAGMAFQPQSMATQQVTRLLDVLLPGMTELVLSATPKLKYHHTACQSGYRSMC